MNVDEIRAYCLSFPNATENLQWGDDLCFKIRGKIFTTLALTAVPQKLCFKCVPESFADLIEREDIRPAPYVGRYKWVMLDRLDALAGDELKEMIGRSYEMVAANAPGKIRNSKRAKVNLPREKPGKSKPVKKAAHKPQSKKH